MSNVYVPYGRPKRRIEQLHLVTAETARAIIPKQFKLVEAFGLFTTMYIDDSPAGIFDEVIWAARVLVNSDDACIHGRKEFGLPSQVDKFTRRVTALPVTKKNRFLHKIDSPVSRKNGINIQVKEMNLNHTSMDICCINLSPTAPQHDSKKWISPAVKISLPSFSGCTEDNPNLLKYSCQIECRLRRAVTPARVTSENGGSETDSADGDSDNYKRNLSISVMLSKPILALEFNCLEMKLEAPTLVP
ncbi:hypothetical protein ACJIZ3_004643 [Penstemon smallii]|uniref:Uncharacterized protein n=1 Tax=Penstemon smallii TaxID=265156 RepID=A0ABD3S2L6_9LAMI